MSRMEIRPITQERLRDLALLFGEGGDPKWCWCASFRLRSADFRKANPDSNRRVLEVAVTTTAEEGRAPGLIAYRDSDPIGWVSLGPRDDFERLRHSKLLAPIDDEPVWSIVCFVVSRRARGEGVATALLEAAVDYARDNGASRLEAYPVETEGNGQSAHVDIGRGDPNGPGSKYWSGAGPTSTVSPVPSSAWSSSQSKQGSLRVGGWLQT